MSQHSDNSDEQELRERIIGLGTHSHHKSYYPELKRRIADLERFKALLNETDDAIFLIAARTGTCIDLNRAATTLTGYSAEELLSTNIEHLLHPDFQGIFSGSKPVQSENFEVQTTRSEVVILTAHGQEVPVEVTIRSVTLTEELFYVVVARDITARKKTEAELGQYRAHLEEMVAERNEELTVANQELILEVKQRIEAEQHREEEKQRLEVTLQAIGDAVITTTLEGEITYLNKAAERLLHYSLSPGTFIRITELMQIMREDVPLKIPELILRSVGTGRIVTIEEASCSIQRGGTKIISFIISPITRSSHTPGVVIVIHDITERVRLSEEIQKHERLESLGVLAGGIAHDFNNVLTAILGNITLSMEMIDPDSPAADRIHEAERATYRAKSLTQQLLTFSKGGAPIRESTQIEDLIRDTAGFATSGSKARVVYEFPESLDMVEIDRGQISQVVQNLVLNAQQAMPDGGLIIIHGSVVDIGSNQVPGLKEGTYVKISFTDEGQGIAKDAIVHIFEPYFSTKETGNGLGLTSSMFIMKKHQGTIEVVSEPGMGTTFTLWLPVSKSSRAELKSESDKEIPVKAGVVLLMDDEEGILNVVSALLKRAGWEVTCAHDGEEAVEAYKNALAGGHPYDAVIMDLVIPGGMGGKDAITAIKAIDAGVYAIVSSGYSNDPIMAEPERYGFSRVLPKPYKIKDLLTLLQK